MSLNYCLSPRPNLLPYLVEILVNFRRWPIGITRGIQKTFLHIQLADEERDVHRYFPPSPGKVNRVMRSRRVTFGVNFSPFHLNTVIGHHNINPQKDCYVVEDLKDNLYVVDFLSGRDTSVDICNMIKKDLYLEYC